MRFNIYIILLIPKKNNLFLKILLCFQKKSVIIYKDTKKGDFNKIIAIGCDHGGINLKEYIKNYLQDEKIEFRDFGTYTNESCDYPDYAKKVCDAILSGECEKGILICGTGIGISIAANKVRGIRAAHVTDTYSARMCVQHNNAHIVCLGERITGLDLGLEIVKTYLSASFLGGRHQTRVDKVMKLEEY